MNSYHEKILKGKGFFYLSEQEKNRFIELQVIQKERTRLIFITMSIIFFIISWLALSINLPTTQMTSTEFDYFCRGGFGGISMTFSAYFIFEALKPKKFFERQMNDQIKTEIKIIEEGEI